MINSDSAPVFMQGHTINFYNDSLYLFGISENDENSFYKFDLKNQKWEIIKSNDYNPKGRYNHKSTVYNNQLFIFFGRDQSKFLKSSTLIYSFTSNKWEETQSAPSSHIFGSSTIQIKNLLYFFLGVFEDTTENSVGYIDLNSPSLDLQVKKRPLKLPPGRKNHLSYLFDSDIFIFGGVTSDKTYLNDVWKFNIDSLVWVKMNPSGNIPKARELMASVEFIGTGFLIFGGRDESTVFSDMVSYNVNLNTWIDYNPDYFAKNPRYGSCLVTAGTRIISIGGQNDFQIFRDILAYDFSNYKEISFDYKLPEELIGFSCYSKFNIDIFEIFIIGGSKSQNSPVNQIVKIDVSGIYTTKVKCNATIFSNFNLALPHYFSLIIDKNWIHIIGGAYQSNQVSNLIISINLYTSQFKSQKFSDEFGLFSHTAVQVLDKIMIFGGVKSVKQTNIHNTASNALYYFKFNKSYMNLTCLNGKQQEPCKPCIPGTFFYNDDCAPCPTGTYSEIYGASIYAKCKYCKYGTFNDRTGATFCKVCPTDSFCPIGSKIPKARTYKSISGSIQPTSWSVDSEKYTGFMYRVLLATVVLYLILILLLMIFEKIRRLIPKIDMFVDRHSNPLYQPVIFKQTLIGGIFTSLFLLFSVITIAFGLYIYSISNIQEIKTLIPTIILEDEIKSDSLIVSLSLNSYSSTCVENGKCMTQKNLSESGFDFKTVSTDCEKLGEDCYMKRIYNDFSLISDGSINFSFDDVIAFSSSISVNISTSSSIPGQSSTVMLYESPPDETKVFKGGDPSIFKLEFIPSVNFT